MPEIGLPAGGQIATDSNSDLDAATKLFLDKLSLTGQDFSDPAISAGDVIEIKSRRDVSRWKRFEATAIVDQGTYLEIDVALAKQGPTSAFQADEDCSLSLDRAGGGGGAVFGTTEQLTIVTDDVIPPLSAAATQVRMYLNGVTMFPGITPGLTFTPPDQLLWDPIAGGFSITPADEVVAEFG